MARLSNFKHKEIILKNLTRAQQASAVLAWSDVNYDKTNIAIKKALNLFYKTLAKENKNI